MNRRSFIRSLAAALISVPLARLCGAEAPKAQFIAGMDIGFGKDAPVALSAMEWAYPLSPGQRKRCANALSKEEFDQWIKLHPGCKTFTFRWDELIPELVARLSCPR